MYISRLLTPSAFQVAVLPAPEQCGEGGSALVFVLYGAASPRGRAALMYQLFSLTPI
jgi:hypothetical protein